MFDTTMFDAIDETYAKWEAWCLSVSVCGEETEEGQVAGSLVDLIWPTNGSRVFASELCGEGLEDRVCKDLYEEKAYGTVVGVDGCYLWGTVRLLEEEDSPMFVFPPDYGE